MGRGHRGGDEGRIQEAASRYDLDSSPQLREAIKAELGTLPIGQRDS